MYGNDYVYKSLADARMEKLKKVTYGTKTFENINRTNHKKFGKKRFSNTTNKN